MPDLWNRNRNTVELMNVSRMEMPKGIRRTELCTAHGTGRISAETFLVATRKLLRTDCPLLLGSNHQTQAPDASLTYNKNILDKSPTVQPHLAPNYV